jgi:hypothetical protein
MEPSRLGCLASIRRDLSSYRPLFELLRQKRRLQGISLNRPVIVSPPQQLCSFFGGLRLLDSTPTAS